MPGPANSMRPEEPYRSTPLRVPPRGQVRVRNSIGWGLAGLVTLGALGGCGFTAAPRTSLGAVATVADRSVEAVRFDVTATLENPNPEDALELRTVEYRVRVPGVGTYRGLRAAQATLAPGGSSVLTLPVVLPAADVGDRTSLEWRLTGRVLYIAPGALAETLLDTGVRRPTVRLRGTGRVSLVDPVVGAGAGAASGNGAG